MDLTRLLRALDGPPVSAPSLIDRGSERWWRLPPRGRAALIGLGVLVTVLAGTLHVASSPWGPPVSVLVATHDLGVGQPVDAGDVRRADWPADLVPDGAVLEATGTAIAPIPAGSIVTDRHLADGGLGTVLPEGRAAVALPTELVPELQPGATLDLVGADVEAYGRVLATGAVVLFVDAEHVWVVVDRAEAADAAAAVLSGAVTVVVVP